MASVLSFEILPEIIANKGQEASSDGANAYDLTPEPINIPSIYRVKFSEGSDLYDSGQSGLKDYARILGEDHNDNMLVEKILSLPPRNWIADQYQNSSQHADSIQDQRTAILIYEQFNWLVWAVSQYRNSLLEKNKKIGLPKINSNMWQRGFEWKGIYIQILPAEDSYYITNEINALKHSIKEIDELQTILKNREEELGKQIESEQLLMNLITPLLAAGKCGSFILYATPVVEIH